MKRIKVKFVGFWPGFSPEDNFIINKLHKKYDVEISDNPEYLFSSSFSDEYLEYDCVRIYYTGECLFPDFNAFDYAIAYEYMAVGDRYCRLPNYYIKETYQTDCDKMLSKHLNVENILVEKSEFCSFVVSKGNGYVDNKREDFFRRLNEYKKVNSGGRYLNNIGLPEGIADKLEFQTKHKFAIAFENTSHCGYSTEKIVQAFAARTIPIYWGDPWACRVFNPKAYIDCNKYSFDEVINKIKEIDTNDELYINMLKEPAVVDEKMFCQTDTEFENFLYNIVDQSYDDAYRRDRIGYGKMFCDKKKNELKKNKYFLYRVANLLYK